MKYNNNNANYDDEGLSSCRDFGPIILGGFMLFLVCVFLLVVESTPVVTDTPVGRVGVNSSGCPDDGSVCDTSCD